MQPSSGCVHARNAVVTENLVVARFTRVVIPAADPKRRIGVGAPPPPLPPPAAWPDSRILQPPFFFYFTRWIPNQLKKWRGVGDDFVRGGQDKTLTPKKCSSYERTVVKADTPTVTVTEGNEQYCAPWIVESTGGTVTTSAYNGSEKTPQKTRDSRVHSCER
jgi:hypothetical protein